MVWAQCSLGFAALGRFKYAVQSIADPLCWLSAAISDKVTKWRQHNLDNNINYSDEMALNDMLIHISKHNFHSCNFKET